MLTEKFTNKKGLAIETYDNLFSFEEQRLILSFLRNSFFIIKATDDDVVGKDNTQICSLYTEKELSNLNFENFNGFQFLNSIYNFKSRSIKQIRVNCVTPYELNGPHTDGYGLTLVYYASYNWNKFWGGHTIFLDDEINEIEKLITFKIGRVVVFNSEIAHSITPISSRAECQRLSLVIQYSKINN